MRGLQVNTRPSGGGGCPVEEECVTTSHRPCSILKRVKLFRTPPVLPGQTRLNPDNTSARPRDTGNPLTEVSVGIRVFIALVHKVTAIPVRFAPALVEWFGVDTLGHVEEVLGEKL